MPVESSNRVLPGVWTIETFVVGNNPQTTTQNIALSSGQSRYVKSRSWLQTPSYLKKKEQHDLPMNAYSVSIVEENYSTGSLEDAVYDTKGTLQTRAKHSGQFGSGTAWGSNVNVVDRPTSGDKASVDAQCSTKMLLTLKGQKVNAMQFIAERNQTYKLIGDTARNLGAAYQYLKRGNVPGAVTALGGVRPPKRGLKEYRKGYPQDPEKAASNLWLQWVYGWKPLIQDVYGAMEHYNSTITKDSVLMAKATVSRTGRRTVLETTPQSGWNATHVSRRSWKYTCKHVIYYKLVNDTSKTMAQLGFTNPALIGWELMPFSFVADWFLPVGNFISSLDATVGLVFLKGCKTTCEIARSYKVTGGKSTQSTRKVNVNIKSNYKNVTIARSTLASFPSVAAPQWKNPVSAVHAANAIALLTQIFYARKGSVGGLGSRGF
jgi:hypothetical protein